MSRWARKPGLPRASPERIARCVEGQLRQDRVLIEWLARRERREVERERSGAT